jgi:hypothetical protein
VLFGFLVVAAAGLSAQHSSSSASVEERCTVRYAGSQCTGLGCEGMAAIVHESEKAPMDTVTLVYPSSSDTQNLGRPEAVIAKALLQLGKQGWELAGVSRDDESSGEPGGMMYHLKRQRHAVIKE